MERDANFSRKKAKKKKLKREREFSHMNYVLEQFRIKFAIPKDVLHLIVDMFRPRPPAYYGEVLEKWDAWYCAPGRPSWELRWYGWKVDTHPSRNAYRGFVRNLGVVSFVGAQTPISEDRYGVCSFCLTDKNVHLCMDCRAAVRAQSSASTEKV